MQVRRPSHTRSSLAKSGACTLLAATLSAGGVSTVLGACGPKFTSCHDRRACSVDPSSEGGGGTGGDHTDGDGQGGDGQGGNGQGGDGEGGAGGNGQGGDGAGEGGEAGHAGAGGADVGDVLVVLSITPDDGETDVERVPSITLVFSRELDESTVTSESIVLEGPQGAVEADLSVSDTEVRLVPLGPLALLRPYRVSVNRTVMALDGDSLESAFEAEFRVRNGVFGSPTLVPEQGGWCTAANSRGDIVVVGDEFVPGSEEGDHYHALRAALYGATSKTWNRGERIYLHDQADDGLYSVVCAVDEQGGALTTWGSIRRWPGGWSRYSPASGWETRRFPDDRTEQGLALLSDGTAVAVFNVRSSTPWFVAFSLLAPNAQTWSPPQAAWGDEAWPALISIGDHVGSISQAESQQFVARVFEAEGGWSQAEAVAPAGATLPNLEGATDGTAVATWTLQNTVSARVFNGSSWAQAVAIGSGGAPRISLAPGPQAAVLWRVEEELHVRRLERNGNWSSADPVGPSSDAYQVSIDDSGNVFVVWGTAGGALRWRRFAPGAGWSNAELLGEGLDPQSGIHAFTSTLGDVHVLFRANDSLWSARYE